MGQIYEEKLQKVKEFNESTVQKGLGETRNNVVNVINELFFMSTEDWDIEQIESGLSKLERAVEEYKIADAKSSISNNIIGFMEE